MNLKNQYVWHSISDLASDLRNAEYISGRYDSSDKRAGSDWSDTSSYDEALERLVKGYEYDDVKSDIRDYQTVASGTKSRSYQDVVGHQVIVPLYLQGIPTNMVNKKPVVDNKIVTMIYECSVPHYVSSQEIKNTTEKFFGKIVELESKGYRTNVWVIENNPDVGGKWGFALKLKTDRETLSFKKMMFPLISPSFLRRIGFRIKERLYRDWIGGGYGRAVLDDDLIHEFVVRNIGVRNYELWNYEGKRT